MSGDRRTLQNYAYWSSRKLTSHRRGRGRRWASCSALALGGGCTASAARTTRRWLLRHRSFCGVPTRRATSYGNARAAPTAAARARRSSIRRGVATASALCRFPLVRRLVARRIGWLPQRFRLILRIWPSQIFQTGNARTAEQISCLNGAPSLRGGARKPFVPIAWSTCRRATVRTRSNIPSSNSQRPPNALGTSAKQAVPAGRTRRSPNW